MQYNIFNKVHLPLKRSLLSTAVYLNSFEASTAYEEALSKVSEVLEIFKEQVEFEEAAILPLIFYYEPSIAANYTNQHKKQLSLVYELEGQIELFKSLIYKFQSLSAFELIYEAFNDFLLSNYHHMDDEEEILNGILRLYYSDNFLVQVEQRMKSHPALIVTEIKSNLLAA